MKKYNGTAWVDTALRQYKTATEAVENPLYSDGTAITAYTIKGNTVQNGTPTPSNPVEVNGVGDLGNNLFNGTIEQGSFNADGTETGELTVRVRSSFFNELSSGTYTIDCVGADDAVMYVYETNDTSSFVAGESVVSWQSMPYTLTLAANRFVRFAFRKFSNSAITPSEISNLMLNSGSTAKPYEPYGYKIPISSGQQTIDIYIGDLPLLKSLDGTAVDEISNGTLTRRVDSDGSVLPTPTTTQITMPSIPTTQGANSISVDTTVQPSEFTATWTGWHDASVQEWDGSQWNE